MLFLRAFRMVLSKKGFSWFFSRVLEWFLFRVCGAFGVF